MHSVEEEVTPARAAKDLETADCGRKPSMKVISDYSRDMKADEWHLTHQGVAYDSDKILRDGQQRYWAVIKAATELAEEGKIGSPDEFSVRMMVTYDMPKSSFPFLDGGKNRSLADNWFIEGYEHAVLLQTVCRRISMWKAGRPVGNSFRPTRSETMAVLLLHPEAREAAAFADGWHVKPPVPSAGIAGFLWWLLGTKSAADRDFFLEALRTGSDISEHDDTKPVLLLRNRLQGDHFTARQRGTSVRPETALYLCLRGWDAWRTRERITKLQMPTKLSDKSFRPPR
jgi:hypothetical protein